MGKVLVTGGAGFIGSHLVEKLLERRYQVIVLDDLIKGKMENLAKVGQQIQFIQADIREENTVKNALNGVNRVVHLAALVSVQESVEKPSLYYEVNTTSSLNLLQWSADAGVERFVYISSCAVYGDPKTSPISETHPLNPLSPYASSKMMAEGYCRMFSKQKTLSTAVLRLFNVYGPRQGYGQYSGVITQFMNRITQNQPPTIYDDGTQTRDFIYVEDVVEYIIRALETDTEEIFNIGSGRLTTINDLAELMLKIMGKTELKPVHLPARKGDIRLSRADISKAEKILGYTPKTGLEEGLRKTLEKHET